MSSPPLASSSTVCSKRRGRRSANATATSTPLDTNHCTPLAIDSGAPKICKLGISPGIIRCVSLRLSLNSSALMMRHCKSGTTAHHCCHASSPCTTNETPLNVAVVRLAAIKQNARRNGTFFFEQQQHRKRCRPDKKSILTGQ